MTIDYLEIYIKEERSPGVARRALNGGMVEEQNDQLAVYLLLKRRTQRVCLASVERVALPLGCAGPMVPEWSADAFSGLRLPGFLLLILTMMEY